MDGEIKLDAPVIKRGGKRPGAGRPKRTEQELERWYQARGIEPLHASEILARVVDERKVWARVLNSDDDRVVLSALTFLVSMRDGRPAQQINVTSQSISVTVDDVARARAIVRELMPSPLPSDNLVPPLTKASTPGVEIDNSEKTAKPLMLSGGEGGNLGGSGDVVGG